jgi:hypothetical protein
MSPLPEPRFLLFASDATLLGLAGALLMLVALAAMVGERRRMRRKHIDAVGYVPWTKVFFIGFFCGVTLLALAITGWLHG